MAASSAPSDSPTASSTAAVQDGAMVCVIDTTRSRITVSLTTDVQFTWRGDGCVNGKTQYGLPPSGWTRILAPNIEDTVSVATFDPATRTYRTDRYLLDETTMTSIRASRSAYSPPQCGGGEDTARRLGESQAAVLALLPPQPNERLIYHCTKTP
jgi:hypothetical protein